MTITYPLTLKVAGRMGISAALTDARWVVYHRDRDCDVDWWAPLWLAWVYCWLPVVFWWANAPEHRVRQYGAYYLWQMAASRWAVGYLPASRVMDKEKRDKLVGRVARWGYLRLGYETTVAL